MKAKAPNQPADRLIDNPARAFIIAFLSFLSDAFFINIILSLTTSKGGSGT